MKISLPPRIFCNCTTGFKLLVFMVCFFPPENCSNIQDFSLHFWGDVMTNPCNFPPGKGKEKERERERHTQKLKPGSPQNLLEGRCGDFPHSKSLYLEAIKLLLCWIHFYILPIF